MLRGWRTGLTSISELFLMNAPIGRHFAQIHANQRARMRAVCVFVERGLQLGNSVVTFASAATAATVLEHLEERGVDAEGFRRHHQLELHDVRKTLDHFMRGGRPDWLAFRELMGSILDRAHRYGQSTRV